MKRLIAAVAFLVLAGLALLAPAVPQLDKTAERPVAEVPAILVVFDAPSHFDGVARSLGFRPMSEKKMDGFGVSVKTILAPAGKAKGDAENMLLKHFPDLIIGSSDLSGSAF